MFTRIHSPLMRRLSGRYRVKNFSEKITQKAPGKARWEDIPSDPRPPWVYSTSAGLRLVLIPSILIYAVFFADFGDREHVFMPTATGPSSTAVTTSQDFGHDSRTTDGSVNAELHALKRTYLTLLPRTQLVELCLAFEAYSPPHVKNPLWPANLAVAVAELQSTPLLTSQETHKDCTSGPVPPPAEGTNVIGTHPQTPNDTDSLETADVNEPSRVQQPQASDSPSQPTPQPVPSTSSTVPAATPPRGPYPLAPYGYQPLAAYPHTSYYPPLSYPHGFSPHPPATYAHAAFPPSQPPSLRLKLTVPHHNGIPTDDLPSYEDMLVEALTDLNEPDGSAPKSLFTWMAARYPLHTNFRPSASQALQKAFKRGRLEKGSNGKYRLNAGWDGGSTSRRTTRRPQTIGQVALPASHGAPTSSPFTHVPLSHPGRNGLSYNPSTSALNSAQSNPPQYPSFPYQYSSGGAYPRNGLSVPLSVSKGEASGGQPPAAAAYGTPAQGALGENNVTNEDVGEGSDAWEAAQTILKAINFGSLLDVAAAKPVVPALGQHTLPATSAPAETACDGAPASLVNDRMTDAGTTVGFVQVQVQVVSDRDRALLQGQLALLAAQLAEIAEDTLASDLGAANANVGVNEGHGRAGDAGD
ncbi:hypothetical protein B0F90DRAFT_1815790 [Multifurca ochricompacta]|uniref:Histone H1 n=1 Tax=Multifurca ochricompacta TaxID=376703 RepID=A0AAD4M7Q0_9AGAM|nr:hypothetical protein B0F90DRAFT_1815790 [Multifurca ochricompacta]